jgi:alkaline phosphatase D
VTPAYDRRTFLRRAGLTGAAAVAVAAGLPRPAAAADDDLAPFLHGVASGDPLADRVILWTRVTPPDGHDGAPIPVEWVVATDPELTAVVASGTVTAASERDFTVKVDPTGLAPFTYYFYAFRALGRTSLVGRTKTAPAAGQGVAHLRFGVVSCSNLTGGFFNAYARVADRDDLDCILHLGDYLYEYGNGDDRYGPSELVGVRDHAPPHEYVTLADYRTRHAQYKLDPDLRRLHQLFPWIVTWDDHESTDNSHRDGANNHGNEPYSNAAEATTTWAERKATAQRVYDEWLPIRSSGDPAVIYRHLPFGDLADIIVLDTRLEGRNPQVEYPGTGEEALGGTILFGEMSDPDRRLISDTQMAWFQDRLSTAPGQWKVVAQQVVVGQWNVGGLPRPTEGTPLQDAPKLIREGGNALNPDSWDGYTADRDRFLNHLRDQGIDDVVVLTGDVHSSWAMDLTTDPANPAVYDPLTGDGSVAVEFVGPSVTSASLGETFGPLAEGQAAMVGGLLATNPHLKFADLVAHGYIVLDVTPERTQSDWYFVDTVLRPSDAEAHAASWKTDAGTNRLARGVAAPPKAPAPALPAPTPPVTPAPPDQPAPATPVLPVTGGGAVGVGVAAVAAATLLRLRGRGCADDA